MKKTTIRNGLLLVAPASLLALSMGCAVPAEPTEDPGQGAAESDTAEEVSGAPDALQARGGGGVGWSTWDAVAGIDAFAVPSVAVWRGVPHMAYIGAGDQCYLSSYVDAAWVTPIAIPGCHGPFSPSLAVHDDYLYTGYVGDADGCYLNHYSRWGWAQPVALSGCGAAFAPAVASYGGALNVVYAGAVDGIYHSSCGSAFFGDICGAGALIPGVATAVAPAVGVYGDELALAFTGLNRQLYYTTYGVADGWRAPVGIRGGYTTFAPTLGWGGADMYLGIGGYRGGFGWAPYTGDGWDRFDYLGAPFRGAAFGLGYFGTGLGALAVDRGRLFMARRGW